MKLRILVLATLVLPTAGCQTWGPTWSELSGRRYSTGEIYQYRRPAIIEQVDGQGSFAQYPIKLEPGVHQITIQGPTRRAGGGFLKTLSIDMAPCRIYYVNAQFKNNIEPEYEPVIDYVDSIAGCTVPVKK
ncbi:MAG: hypothetical protein ABI885_28005 [Gammaproteobacteria bacterium]